MSSLAKARTARLVGEIEKAMGRDLAGLPWMDAPTREKAEEKFLDLVARAADRDQVLFQVCFMFENKHLRKN